jgi:hypothetical protein
LELLNVSHTKTLPAHPQCNSQVEVFIKTMKKYLASFVDDTALNWEVFLPALAPSYNTSYHSTLTTTPFEMLFGKKHGSHHFPMKISRKFITERHLRQKDSIYFKKIRKVAHEQMDKN